MFMIFYVDIFFSFEMLFQYPRRISFVSCVLAFYPGFLASQVFVNSMRSIEYIEQHQR